MVKLKKLNEYLSKKDIDTIFDGTYNGKGLSRMLKDLWKSGEERALNGEKPDNFTKRQWEEYKIQHQITDAKKEVKS